MTLKDFQSSGGIPEKKQICLPVRQGSESCWIRINLELGSPRKSRLKVGELRKWLNALYKAIWKYKLGKTNLPERSHVCFSDKQGRMKRIDLLESVITILGDKLKGCTLLLGKSDMELDHRVAGLAQRFNFLLFGNNLNTEHPNLGYLPMGRNWRGRKYHHLQPSADKNCLVYCNFSTDTHLSRRLLYEKLKTKKFLDFDHMGNFLDYPIGHEEFYNKLRRSKFSIAPRGNAIETFRMWDCLYLGTIPIVVKEAVFHKELEDLPIFFIDSYGAYASLSEEVLNQIYDEMCSQEWNYVKLTNSFWMDRISQLSAQSICT